MDITSTFTLPVNRHTFDHEIRTPLSVMLGAVHLLINECQTPTQREYIGYISQAAKRLLAFADSLANPTTPAISSNNPTKKTISQPWVLLVEDDQIIQRIHKKNLSDLGCRVDVAGDGKKAVEMAAAHEYHLILMDVGLPSLNGIEAAAAIRRHENFIKHTPIVGLTGYSDDETQKECKAAGMDEVIVKPVALEKLKELLTQFC
jgi:CheY-like chemotaxis protein